jgi:hypothetical protein
MERDLGLFIHALPHYRREISLTTELYYITIALATSLYYFIIIAPNPSLYNIKFSWSTLRNCSNMLNN